MRIGNQEIRPGEYQVVNFYVGKLPSGNKIFMRAHVFRSLHEGPTMLITAGIHGDEVNGVEIVRRCLEGDLFRKISKGTVIAIPVVNVYGFINFSREVPDGKDVNRSFPGNSRGSLASRVASILSKKILPNIDFGLDLHTGGAARYNYPQIRVTKGNEHAKQLATYFGAEIIVEKGMISKSLRKNGSDQEKTIIVFEGGEATRLDGLSIRKGYEGIRGILSNLGMLEEQTSPSSEPRCYKKTSWVRATDSGLFIWQRSSGDVVQKDESLGVILDPNQQSRTVIKASKSGFIIGHNNAPVVHVGDALFHIAYG